MSAASRAMAEHGAEPVAAAGDVLRHLDQAMERYIDGDLAAYDELYAGLAPRIYRYLVMLSGNRTRADDLLQVTFLRLHQARASWIRGARIAPYVYAIARNTAYDDARQRAATRVRLSRTGEVPDIADETPEAHRDEALASLVDAALRALPPRYREAVILTKYQELTHREAALVVGTTETAMKLRVHRAYAMLRERLAQLAPESPG